MLDWQWRRFDEFRGYLQNFDFQPEGEPYNEDGIIHTKMRLLAP
jgi:predicted GNAT family N-acyltransferase